MSQFKYISQQTLYLGNHSTCINGNFTFILKFHKVCNEKVYFNNANYVLLNFYIKFKTINE